LRGSFALRHPVETYRILRTPNRLARVLGHHVSPKRVRELLEEARPITSQILDRFAGRDIRWPEGKVPGSLAMPDRGPLIYAAVRALKPDKVVETGVASGASTYYILSAMHRNQAGRLYSVDLPPGQWRDPNYGLIDHVALPIGKKPGWLIPEWLGERWIFQPGDTRQVLPGLIGKLAPVDLFLHDSEHSFDVMRFEFETAWPCLRKEGILASDDIGWSNAFQQFVHLLRTPYEEIGPMGFARKTKVYD
jgi:hypothetical protein